MGLHIKAKLRGALERQQNRRYACRLAGAKRRISYEEWLGLVGQADGPGEDSYRPGILPRGQKDELPEKGISRSLTELCGDALEQGLALLKERGIWLILQEQGYPDPEAFAWIAAYFEAHPQTLLLYGDEDALDVTGEHRYSPYFKPEWSPDTWLSCFYPGSVVALRRELAEKLPPGTWPRDREGVVFFREHGQVRRLVHQLLALAGGFDCGCASIARLPGMLFHMSHEGVLAGVQTAYRREDGFDGKVWTSRSAAKLSIIIPSKDNPKVLGQCLESLAKCWEACCQPDITADLGPDSPESGLCPWEILVVDNGSSPENRAEIEKLTRGMGYIYEPMPFNFSKMCNLGAREATGELLLFLNDDITVCPDGWLEAMAERALRPYVGAVGLKLYYPDSTMIQHAGIANLPGGPVHKLQFTRDGQEEDYGYGSLNRNAAAVTGACLMVRRDRFQQAGGFPEDLQVAYNDVELCIRLREAGWHNVVLNRFHAWHHESLSRGGDLTREKMERLRRERQTLYRRHPAYLAHDPYYPEPLCMELGDTHIYGVYLDTRAGGQKALNCRRLAECPEREPENLAFELGAFRSGELLCLQGYLVVRWDNNACYDRYLLLKSQGGDMYAISLEEQYSREAEYGMQEQPNVALCGFRVILEQGLLPAGYYKIGFQARSRIGRRRLTLWTEEELLPGFMWKTAKEPTDNSDKGETVHDGSKL